MDVGTGLRRPLVVLLVGGVLGIAATAGSGTWTSLPDAVTRLQRLPGDRAALQLLQDAEDSVLVEAAAGHLNAVVALMEAYENLVMPLDDGYTRLDDLRSKISKVLVGFGDSRLSSEPQSAGQAWAVAASYDPSAGVLERLKSLLLPPAEAEPGAVWKSPFDGSELVFHPSLQFLAGCSFGDGGCQNDESSRFVRTRAFWIDRNEVTNRAFRTCVVAGRCPPPVESDAFGDPARTDFPVVGITYRQARAYAEWVGRRLPSEVEWERAARGDDNTGRFPWGRGRGRGVANLMGRTDEDRFDGLAPVGSFPSTGLGLNDMGGNVWEWCADTYHHDPSAGPPDGTPWVSNGWGRVLRGGSWRRTAEVARVSNRTWQEEEYFADDVGFRTVVDEPSRIGHQDLVVFARRTYLTPESLSWSLDDADLSTADRRYLERMALTWLVLEGRIAEALPRAVALLRRDPRDSVALDLLDQLEKEMADAIQRGNVARAESALRGYRRAVEGDRRLARRLAGHERRLLEQMRVSVHVYVDVDNPDLASAGVGFARLLDPDDPLLGILLAGIEPSPGTIRVSARDQKEMAWIPGGEYSMGASPDDRHARYDEHPAHQVVVNGFWLDRTEVTNDEYRRCVDAEVCAPPRRTAEFDDPEMGRHPVLWVDWFQARTYAAWARKRLPTEAEWEWAARAGQSARYPWGDLWQDGRVNALGTAGPDRWDESAPVASFAASPWALHDMLGNAGEWVQDAYHSNYWRAPSDARPWMQFTGEPVDRKRVVRGGSYLSPKSRLRLSFRSDRAAQGFNRGTGFRCARNR